LPRSPITPQAPRLPYPSRRSLAATYQTRKVDAFGVRQVLGHVAAADPRFLGAGLPGFVGLPMTHLSPLAQQLLNRQKGALTQDLVALSRRPQQELTLKMGERSVCYQQSFGHVQKRSSGALVVVPGRTLSSDAIKRDRKKANAYMRDYNANLGCVHRGDDLVLVRSARIDTVRRLEEQLIYGAVQAAAGDNPGPQGFAAARPYRPALISLLDLSPRKAWAMRLKRLLCGRGEVETEFLQRQNAAIEALFGDAPSLRRSVNGRQYVLLRPLSFNLAMSAQAKHPHHLTLSRRYNAPAAHALFAELANVWARGEPGPLTDMGMRMQGCTTAAQRLSYVSGWTQRSVAMLPAGEQAALEFLKLTLSHLDLRGAVQFDATAPGHELLLLQQALAAVGRVPHVSCKSGQDRTLSGLSILLLGDAFARLVGRPFAALPGREGASGLQAARALFTQAANRFGSQSIRLVRGYGRSGRAKWALFKARAHPWPQAFFIPAGNQLGLPEAPPRASTQRVT
jgi:hypothetical protein